MARTTRPLLALSLGAVVMLAACGSSGSSKAGSGATSSTAASTTTVGPYPKPSSTTTSTAPPGGSAAVVSLATTKLGPTLVDSTGHTLYEFKSDPMGSSTCKAQSATLWPPLTTPATTVAVGTGLTASLFTTVPGEGSTYVVAVAGHPLYRFSADKKAGDTNGEGLAGVWHAAVPTGATM